jgi:allophanate hydrolase
MTSSNSATLGTTTTVERVRQAFEAIEAADRPEVWISLRSQESAIAEAQLIDAKVAAGCSLPLAGLLVAVKDNIDVAGMETTAAHPGFARLPEQSATAVQRLIDAGALVLGKTNLDQFATGLVGTRSPYGAVRNSRFPERISGGSSSGSAVAVAMDMVDFALGTDTAGSGRVPAALNQLVGIKSTLGIVPVDGVVPACRSYDCVTVFAKTLELATLATKVMAGPSKLDGRSRSWPANVKLAAAPASGIAIPQRKYLEILGPERLGLFDAQVAKLRELGYLVSEIEFEPFIECAKLLYGGGLVAERYAAFGEFLEGHPDGADPTVTTITIGAKDRTGPGVIAAQQSVAEYGLIAAELLEGFEALLIPTAPAHPTLAEVAADPIAVNSLMGTYTNFMNLLDMCGVAIPAGQTADGLFGVTVVARKFEDQVAIDVAAQMLGQDTPLVTDQGIDVAVFGAHLSGQPLNYQLVNLGARFMGPATTAPNYRMFALDTQPAKPGLVTAAEGGGVAFEGEIWRMSAASLGEFMAVLPQPMMLGKVVLKDQTEVVGFGCSRISGTDISRFGGWRNFLASR